jgi:hypothetical protein
VPGDWDKPLKLWGILWQWPHTKPSPTNKQTNRLNSPMMWIQPAGSAWRMRKHHGMSLLSAQHLYKQVGNPTSTTSQLKTRDSKDSARA